MSTDESRRIDVFEFQDSRRYLEEHYGWLKRRRPGFSYRAFARLADLKSPNYLALVITGKRNLSDAMAVRFAKACGLSADRASYFLELVRFTQASSPEAKRAAYAQMSTFRGYRRIHELEGAIAQYHEHWYIPAIRELAARDDFCAEPKWLAKILVPSIPVSEARKAVRVLFQLGLLVEGPHGQVERGTQLVTTGQQTRSVHMTRFHQEMLERARHALDEFPAEIREVSSVTLCMGGQGLQRLKEATRRFRRELLALEELETEPGQVFQVNLQIFPLSKRLEATDVVN